MHLLINIIIEANTLIQWTVCVHIYFFKVHPFLLEIQKKFEDNDTARKWNRGSCSSWAVISSGQRCYIFI